jgi:hypothetical protein
MDPIAPPEHADNVPLGDLLNALPVPEGHGINTVEASRKRVKLAKMHVRSTSNDVEDECVYTHKVIERHIVGGNVLPPLDNAPLSAAEFHAALQPGGVITNVIAAAFDAAFAPDGVGANSTNQLSPQAPGPRSCSCEIRLTEKPMQCMMQLLIYRMLRRRDLTRGKPQQWSSLALQLGM